jgi:hypothetical protein
LNAIYQGGVGLLLIAHPPAAGAIYGLSALSAIGAALCRIVGGLMAGNALVLAAFAMQPEANPGLAPLLAAGCMLNLAADGAACTAGEIRWSQVAGSLIFQLLLVAVLAADLLRVRQAGGRLLSPFAPPDVQADGDALPVQETIPIQPCMRNSSGRSAPR